MKIAKLTDPGQIKEGDLLLIETDFCPAFSARAQIVIRTGSVEIGYGEEIVYNRGKNHYFITSMVLSGTSWVDEVRVVTP